jgi:hypothetical protein
VELSLVVAAMEVDALVVLVKKVDALVVAVKEVDALVVAAKDVAAVVVTSPNWKFQSLPRQTQCPACIIGHDIQHSFQVSIHHSLQGILACFYSGQVLPCPQVL